MFRGVALPELEIELVADRNHHCRSEQPGEDVHHIVVAAIYRRQAKQDHDEQVEVADGPQVAEREIERTQSHRHMAAG